MSDQLVGGGGGVGSDESSPPHSARGSNPFISNFKMTSWRVLQVCVMSLTILPIRILLILITAAVTWAFAALVTFGLDSKPNKPAGRLRKRLYTALQFFCRLLLFFMGVHWIQVRGKRVKAHEAPILVVSPHSSMFDIILFLANSPVPSGLSRVENSEYPFIRTLCLAAQVLWVARDDSPKNTIQTIKERMEQPGDWPQLIIFSEGTTTNRTSIVKFKHGAFIPALPVQPVVVEYLNSWDTVTWTCDNDDERLELLWFSLCQFQINVRVTYLQVYHPHDGEKEDPEVYADNVQQLMARHLHLPCSQFSCEDNKLMLYAKNHGLPVLAGAIGFVDLRTRFGLDFQTAKDLLHLFSRMAKADGVVSKKQFLEFFRLPECEVTLSLYGKYDYDQAGVMDFHKFVLGRLNYFMFRSDRELSRVFCRVSNGNYDILQLEDLFRIDTNDLNKDGLTELFYSITNRPLTVAKYDEFQQVTCRWPEYARLLDELTTNYDESRA